MPYYEETNTGYNSLHLAAYLLPTLNCEKGTAMWGGNLIGGYVQTDKAGELNVLLSPKVARFVRKGLAVGGYANPGYVRALTRWLLNGPIRQVCWAVTMLLERMQVIMSGSSCLFVEANAGYGGTTIADVSSSGINLGIGPGFAYFIRENAAIEGIIKYDAFLRFRNESAINEIRFGLGFQLYLSPRREKVVQTSKTTGMKKQIHLFDDPEYPVFVGRFILQKERCGSNRFARLRRLVL